MNRSFSFEITVHDNASYARRGIIHTPHGDIHTPAFVPVGTQATVKSLTPDDLESLGVYMFFVNTYHMYLRPGMDVLHDFGGLHRFMHWDRPLITDSGGFQVFSLGRTRDTHDESGADPRHSTQAHNTRIQNSLVKISEDGVQFRSHWDGSQHLFTPESSMAWQWIMGGDIHIAFDDCTGYPVTEEKAAESMARTHRWAKRSLEKHQQIAAVETSKGKPYQALYGSIQGSVYKPLREESARFISALDFDGIAVGGVSVGESKNEMTQVLDWVAPLLPSKKPIHLLGVGEIDDIFAAIEHGIDTFDCVQPTRLARMGWVFSTDIQKTTKEYILDISKSVFSADSTPIDRTCSCYTCSHFSRAYIYHLFHVKELLAYRLATIHNITFIQRLVERIRSALSDGTFLELKKQWLYNR